MAALVLLPVASHPFDVAVLTGTGEAWLRWGVSPFYQWKFGFDYTALTVAGQAGRLFLAWLGVPGIVAIHVAWKLPMVAANLVSAVVLYRLGERFIPRHAGALAALWLVNPVVLWVSAGHGQVESIAALSVFLAIALCLSGRLFWAGLVTGLGTGIEYFPLVVGAAVFAWWLGGQLRVRQVGQYALGLALSLALSFGPLIVDPIGRAGLLGGLASSSGFDVKGLDSVLTIWTVLGTKSVHYWPAFFLASALAFFIAMLVWRQPTWDRGIVLVAGLIVLVLVWDSNSLPQFALIAATALYLLAVSIPVNPLVLVGIPVAGISTYFLVLDNGASNANAFFYDAWSNLLASLWEPPQSASFASNLGRLFAAGLVAAFAYAFVPKGFASRKTWFAGMAIGFLACLALCIWAAQPVFWIGAFRSSTTADLPDFDWAVRSRPGVTTLLGADTYRMDFSDSLVMAAKNSRIEPQAGFRISTPDFYSSLSAGELKTAGEWGTRSAILPSWNRMQDSVSSVSVEVFIRSPDKSQSALDKSHLVLLVNNIPIPAEDVRPLATGGGLQYSERADFTVPSTLVEPTGVLRVRVEPESLIWIGSGTDPWMRILPKSGSISADSNGQARGLVYQLGADGRGYLTGLPLISTQTVRFGTSNLSIAVGQAVVRWPPNDTWSQSVGIRLMGGVWLLALVGGAAGLIFWLARDRTIAAQKPGESSVVDDRAGRVAS